LDAIMDVGDWLRGLGLKQYEAAFRDNAVDSAVVPKLTVDDLKELGVALVGHRRMIISAIEELNAASSFHLGGIKSAPTPRPVLVGAAPDVAERRQLTVMFCDLAQRRSWAQNGNSKLIHDQALQRLDDVEHRDRGVTGDQRNDENYPPVRRSGRGSRGRVKRLQIKTHGRRSSADHATSPVTIVNAVYAVLA
jgi:hypothetical protein